MLQQKLLGTNISSVCMVRLFVDTSPCLAQIPGFEQHMRCATFWANLRFVTIKLLLWHLLINPSGNYLCY
jgi:hypothetical protein